MFNHILVLLPLLLEVDLHSLLGLILLLLQPLLKTLLYLPRRLHVCGFPSLQPVLVLFGPIFASWPLLLSGYLDGNIPPLPLSWPRFHLLQLLGVCHVSLGVLSETIMSALELLLCRSNSLFQRVEVVPCEHVQGRVELLLEMGAETEFFSLEVP